MRRALSLAAAAVAGRTAVRPHLGSRTSVVSIACGGGVRFSPRPDASFSRQHSRLAAPADAPTARRAALLATVRQTVSSSQDAFYVVDLKEVVRKFEQWKAELPRVRPCYAVKCNDDPKIVETLAALGAGFDCASRGEIALALRAGVAPSDIIFAHPAKQPSHLHYAAARGVSRSTFDNEDELRKIAAETPGAEVVLRILADDSHSVVRLGLKFGCPLGEVGRLVDLAASLDVKLVGISYHVGSGNGCADSFGAAVADARRAFDIAAARGTKLTLLDIGGGFPGSELGATDPASDRLGGAPQDASDPYAKHPSFSAIAECVRTALDRHFPEGCGVELIAEPGRFFVKSSHALAVNVVGKRRTVDETGTQRWNYYVNDGIYGSFNCIDRDHAACLPSMVLSARGSLEQQLDMTAVAPAGGLADDSLVHLNAQGRPVVSDALGLGHAFALRDAMAPLVAALEDAAAAAESGDELEERGLLRMSAGGGSAVSRGGGGGGGSSGLRAGHGPLSASLGGSSQSSRVGASHGSQFSSLASPAVHPTTIWGPTCDSIDKITDVAHLPEAHIGDWFVFENMGAYTSAGACKFNGFPISRKVYLNVDGSVEAQPEATLDE